MKLQEMSVFPIGEANSGFAKYFIGKSYLNMLSTEQVVIGNVTFEPDAEITGIYIMRRAAADSC